LRFFKFNLYRYAGDYELDSVEAWAVGPRPEEEPGAKKKGKVGVLDARYNEARQLMETGQRDAGGPEREER
jgi:hypothetical protein